MPENQLRQTDYTYKNYALHPSAPARQHCIWIFALLRHVAVFNGLPCIWPINLCPWNVFCLVPFFLRTNVSLESYLSTCNEWRFRCHVYAQWIVVALGTLCVNDSTSGNVLFLLALLFTSYFSQSLCLKRRKHASKSIAEFRVYDVHLKCALLAEVVAKATKHFLSRSNTFKPQSIPPPL